MDRGSLRRDSAYAREDYDAEAEKLFKTLNLNRGDGTGSQFAPVNAVFRHPHSGGVVYVGNIQAARSKEILDEYNIRFVVNCQDVHSENFHEGKAGFQYFRWPIAHWWRHRQQLLTHDGVRRYFAPFFSWVDRAIEGGGNVLIHCLAGAHRAGTSGVAYLMHKTKLPAIDAIKLAKKCRPIINPIHGLVDVLKLLDAAHRDEGRSTVGNAVGSGGAGSAAASSAT